MMTEEIRYIAKLQRQEELDNEVTELEDELKRLEQERDELKKTCEKCKLFDIEKTNRDLLGRIDELEQENKELKELNKKICEDWEKGIKVYWNALEEIRELAEKSIKISYSLEVNSMLYDIKHKINEVLQ